MFFTSSSTCVVIGGLVNTVYYKFLFEIPQGHYFGVLLQSCCGMTGFGCDLTAEEILKQVQNDMNVAGAALL